MIRLALMPSFSPRLRACAIQSVHDRFERDAAAGMALRVEEHLHVPYIVAMCAFEIGPGEVKEVLLGDQHRHALVVYVQKVLQLGELIGAAQRIDRFIGQADVVARGEREHQFRFEAALDVNMQLAFRQLADQKVAGGGHGGSIWVPSLAVQTMFDESLRSIIKCRRFLFDRSN